MRLKRGRKGIRGSLAGLLAAFCVGSTLSLAGSIGSQMVRTLNRIRAHGAPCASAIGSRVHWSSRLARLAKEHSREMAEAGRIGHRGFRDRLHRSGYRTGAENVASGYGLSTPGRVIRLWLKSPAHCRNLMNPAYDRIGIARARQGKQYYWTLLLGRSR
jgi:uncharacterized protein YkwD